VDVNLTDWLGTHLGLLWLSLGVMLLALEWLRRDLTMALLALGPAVAALLAIVVPQAWYAHLLVGVIASLVGVLLVRPALLKREARTAPPAA